MAVIKILHWFESKIFSSNFRFREEIPLWNFEFLLVSFSNFSQNALAEKIEILFFGVNFERLKTWPENFFEIRTFRIFKESSLKSTIQQLNSIGKQSFSFSFIFELLNTESEWLSTCQLIILMRLVCLIQFTVCIYDWNKIKFSCTVSYRTALESNN